MDVKARIAQHCQLVERGAICAVRRIKASPTYATHVVVIVKDGSTTAASLSSKQGSMGKHASADREGRAWQLLCSTRPLC